MDAAFEKHAPPGGSADGREDGGRSADDEGAGRRHHHHGHRTIKGGLERLLHEKQRHHNQADGEQDDAHGIELFRPVEETLGFGLLGLRFLDHAHQFFDSGILRQLGYTDLEATGLIDSAGENRVANAAGHGDGLASQGCLVDGTAAFDNNAIQSDIFPWPDYENISDGQLRHRQQHGPAIPPGQGLFRAQFHQ